VPIDGAGLRHELAVAGVVVGLHVADHVVVPHVLHVPGHVLATAGLIGAGSALGLDAADLGLARARLFHGARHGGFHGTAVVATLGTAAAIPALRPMFLDAGVAAASRRELVWRALVAIPIGTAVYEEVLFRGLLLGLADRRWSRPTATVVTSLAFGAWHVLPTIADHESRPSAAAVPLAAEVAATVTATTIAGLAFTRLRRRSDSLLAPVLVHAAVNVATLAVSVLASRPRRRGPVPPDGVPLP